MMTGRLAAWQLSARLFERVSRPIGGGGGGVWVIWFYSERSFSEEPRETIEAPFTTQQQFIDEAHGEKCLFQSLAFPSNLQQ